MKNDKTRRPDQENPENGTPETNVEEPETEATQSKEQTAEEEVLNKEADEELDLIKMAQAKIDEYKDTLMRVQAEFDNYRKRTADAVSKARADGADGILEAFLPILDSVEIALGMITDEATKKGVELIKKQFVDLFSKCGVSEIDALDKEFDPAFHNAVMQVEDPDRAGKVVEVIRKGYIRNGKVIRYAMVKVAN